MRMMKMAIEDFVEKKMENQKMRRKVGLMEISGEILEARLRCYWPWAEEA